MYFGMTILQIEKTSNTPKVIFDPQSGVMRMEGRSIPENPGEFYKPLVLWLAEYFKSPQKKTTFEFKYEYINSGSSKSLLEMFRMIKEQHTAGNECIVKWYYEEDDESVQELGEHFQYTLKIPFEFETY